jgi:hypothetical protein
MYVSLVSAPAYFWNNIRDSLLLLGVQKFVYFKTCFDVSLFIYLFVLLLGDMKNAHMICLQYYGICLLK